VRTVRITGFLLLGLMAAFVLLAARCFYLQYYKRDYYAKLWLQQRRSVALLKPRRGSILDCQGRVLAASNRIQVIFAEPRKIKDPKATATRLAPILNMPAHEICKAIVESKNPGYARIKVGATEQECAAAKRIPGIGVQSDWRRYYPMGSLAAHVVGFSSLDNRGLAGIELKYDSQLRGSPGQNIFFADVGRRPIRLLQQNGTCVDGSSIILTLNSTIQQFARDELLKQFKAYNAESALAIVAEPKSGAILAMVSLPDFDPANFAKTDPNRFRNQAVTEQFEPGSVIKPIVAAIALDAGVVTTQEKIYCEKGSYGGPRSGFGTIHEYRRGFEDLTVKEILIHSSNIGMAKIGQRLGRDRLYQGLKAFGFGQPVGVELPGEAAGRLRDVEQWTGYSVTRIPFGQEISVTALQLVRAFCILASGGRLVHLHLVKAVVDPKGRIRRLNRPLPPVAYIIRPDVARWIVADALAAVVNEGTGKRARLEKWQLFGKTGTANIYDKALKRYSQTDYVASFAAGAPADDPAVVVLVSIRKPDKRLGKGYTGGVVAAPVAARIIEKTMTYLQNR